ncbi:MAG: carboxypeptidase regulatory-like domain-containing protein [Candidatus Cloacimonetes bacterium]|nr:carboxypeptidase regulatory-like domain-containing protein [Candidatus Cloacimonadota bacterium]
MRHYRLNSPSQYTVSVFNNGTADQSAYTVKLFDGNDVELATTAGSPIAAGTTEEITLSWTPTAEGPMTIYGQVFLTGDINPGNDLTNQLNLSVQPEGIFSVTIGDGDLTEGVPWEFFYKCSLFQTLYYQNEMSMFGSITAVSFYNNFTNSLTDKPIKIWLGSTTAEDLSAGWIDPTTLTLVYDGTMNFPSGANTITIPLQIPYTYAGGNLVLYANRPLDAGYFSSSDDFLAQTVGTNRARKLTSDSTDYDPMAPSATGTLSGTFPKTTFIMAPLSDEPLFVVSPSEQDFGTVLVSSTAQQNFFIANAGGGALGINSISLTGNAAFTLTDLPTLPESLNTGETLLFGLDFSPSTEGEHTAQITITDNVTREVHTIDVTGDGYDATIYSLPFMENWDTASVPDFPLGWSYIHNSTATSSYLRTSTISPFSAPNCVQMANSTDAAAELILISPIIDAAIDINSIRVKLMMKGGTDHLIQIGTIVDPTDPSTFELYEGVTVPTGWAEYIVNLTPHTGTGRYIAIKHGLFSTYDTSYIDDVTFEEIAANDLAASSIIGNTTPSVNVATNYTVNVFNNGTSAQADYSVQIVDDEGTILVSAAGVNVDPGETVSLILSYTPTTEGTQSIMGKVVLAGDVNSVNDISSPLNILVQPEDIVSVTIGIGDETQGVPWEFFYKNSLFQTLYYPDEFGMFGQITGISFYNNFTSDLTDQPIKLWLGTTTEADLSVSWIDPTSLTLVYDGTMNFPSGQNTITIPLIAPFNYFSGNLVLYANRPMDTQYYNSSDDFQAQTVGSNRARKLYSDGTTYDPMAPSATGTLSGTFPKTTFFMTVDGMGALSGTVSSSGSPLADVVISIDDTTFETITSASGQYSFAYLLEDDYTLSAHKIGYEDQSIDFSIVEDETTIVDIAMTASASVNVTGSIVGSDNPTVGLSDGVINLYGPLDYTANTNAAGQFVVENVLSGNTYEYAISRAGYQTATGTIIVGAGDYAMGTINLLELTLPPSGITATVNAAETAVNLIWGAPGTPGNFHFFDFELDNGGWVASSNWTGTGLPNYPNGDWQWNNTYDVTNYDPSGSTYAQVPPQTAYSGTGMIGTNIYGPYANCAVSGERSFLRQSFDLSVFSDPVLSFWHHMDGYNTWDYGQILVNGTEVWGTSAEAVFMPWQELTIDLSAYEGLTEAEISFEWVSTTVVNYAGWYIDDIYIGPADRVAYTSSPSIIPGGFRLPSRPESAQLTEERAASLHPAKNIASSPRQLVQDMPRPPIHTPSRLPLGYKVWRLEYGQENTPNLWVSLTPAMITDTTFVDPAWPGFPDGLYKWAVKTIYTNNVESNAGFSNNVRKQPNDMSAISISGNTTPTVGTPSEYTVRIKNTGTAPKAAGAYTVKIMSGTTELSSVAGPAIAVDQTIDFAVNWNPTAQGPIQIFAKVVLPDDSNPTNDQTPPISLLVMPAGQFAYTVGNGDQLANIPMYMYYKASLFQMIIYPAELGNFMGFVNAVQFYNNFLTDLPDKPTKIWFETTTLENLADGWVPITNNSTLVFDGNVNYPSGENTITIPFAEPFMYLNGENLLITVQRPLDGAYFSSSDKFKAQTIGNNRARETHSDTIEYDPAVPPTAGVLSGQFPMTTLLGIPGGVGHLSGTVTTGTNNAPLEGVSVQIPNAGYAATTNAAGEYQIQYILPNTYNVDFSKYGYISQTQVLELEEDEEAVMNANMNPMPKVPVNGTIIASDTGSGIAGAVIALTGYANYSQSSSGNGAFTFPEVYANESYEYIISCPGYTSTTGIIDVGSTAYQMPTITLNEVAYAPHSVVAELNTTYTAALLEWEAPDPNAVEILESFEGTAFPPQDWSQIITNTGPQNSMGAYPTFKRLGTIEIAGETNATPTHGSFQTGLWWSYEHQDEWLVTPTFNCPPDAYMKFDTRVFLGSDGEDHYYVKLSTDGGNSWQVLWDASAQVGGLNAYATPIVVDLAAFGGQQLALAFQAEDPPTNDGLWNPWFIDNIYIGNAITTVSFEGPALRQNRPVLSSNMPAAEANSRSGKVSRNNNAPSVSKGKSPESRVLVGYKIYRFVSGQEANEASWSLLNDELQSILSFEDEGWETLPNATYRWGIKAIYTAGVSSPAALSNPLAKENVTGNIVGFIRRSNGQGIAGATVAASTYTATSNSAGAYSLVLPVGAYSVSVSAQGFHSVTVENVVVSPQQNTTLNITLAGTAGEDELSPVTATALKGNSPNPFNPTTTIYYDILEPCNVRLDVYNVKGQKVRSLLNETVKNGRHSIVFEARDDNGIPLSSGIYFYRFNAGKYNATRKMLLME